MGDEVIAEAIQLMSSMSQNDIKEALQAAFRSPGPPISARTIQAAVSNLKSPDTQLQRKILVSEPDFGKAPAQRQTQHHHTYKDGTQAAFEVDYIPKPKLKMPIRPKDNVETLWKEVEYLPKAEQRADAFLKTVDKLNTVTDKIDVLIKAAEKCGIPRTQADLLAKNGNIENALKAALTRQAVKTAVLSGAWQSAALTAVFDINRLFDGHLKQYLLNVGVSGLYGGSVGGLSAWVNHPFFGNGIVLGVVVGSAFGAVSLASTGDWARFGKGLGVNILGGAAAWGGGAAGGAWGAAFGPIGAVVGTVVGGTCAGFAGRHIATQIPSLGGMTDHEVKTMYESIRQQLASSGLEPDPSLAPRQVVEATMAKGTGNQEALFKVRMTDTMVSEVTDLRKALLDLQEVSPAVFREFLDTLRAARAGM